MASIFGTEDSVFFVGGPRAGSQAGNANAGGCTKDWFDNSFTQLGDIMGSNGQPLIADADATLAEYDTNKKVTRASGDFTGIEVGMVAYISDGGGEITTGRYKITTVAGDNSYIYVDGLVCSGNSAGDVTINIGGAFDSIDNAICQGNLDASGYEVDVYTNKDETLSSSLTPDWAAASKTTKVVGFYESPGDMDCGGDYYESAMEIHRNGGSVTSTKTVTWDGDGTNMDLLVLNNTELGTEWRNITFTNVSGGNYLVEPASGADNHAFVNCRFVGVLSNDYLFRTRNYFLVLGCYFNATNTAYACIYGSGGNAVLSVNSVFDNKSATYGLGYGVIRSIFMGCYCIGGSSGIICTYDTNNFIGCVFYNQTSRCIWLGSQDNVCTNLINNIFYANDGCKVLDLTKGHLVTSINNLCYPISGSLTDLPEWGVSLEVDPKFMDAANGDFRLKPDSPCINGGYTPDDSFVSIGPWQRKSMLPVEYY